MAREREPGGRKRGAATTAEFTLSWDGRVIEGGRMEDGVEELRVTWMPCVVGGKAVPTITGLREDFLPRGVELELVKVERRGEECLARYRVVRGGRG